tara:strand:- start:7541 stop:7765 length:225 start_codon:yes stop_codon:yes gene_type:complete
MEPKYNFEDYVTENEEDEYVTRCIVDPMKRNVRLLSSHGDEKEVDCENLEEFMNILELVRAVVPDEVLVYVNPL